MRIISTEELLALQDMALFCEADLPATPVYQKLGNAQGGNDVLVRPIQEDEHMRLGLDNMDECERKSKKWGVLSLSDLPQEWSLPNENAITDVLDADVVV